MYALLNADKYDVDLRKSLSEYLTGRDQIATFAAMLLPPNVRIESETLSRMMDCKSVLRTVNEFLNEQAFDSCDEYVSAAVSRFQRALKGGSTLADE